MSIFVNVINYYRPVSECCVLLWLMRRTEVQARSVGGHWGLSGVVVILGELSLLSRFPVGRGHSRQ